MKTQIKYTGSSGNVLIANGAEGISAEQIARAMELPDGAWEEITLEEAEELRKPSLDEAKQDAKNQLKAYRQHVEASGFDFMGQHWDSEQKDELRLNSAGKLFDAGLTEYPGWKISDGVYITLTPEILREVNLEFMRHIGNAFTVEMQKLAEIEALSSPADVQDWLENNLKQGWDSQ